MMKQRMVVNNASAKVITGELESGELEWLRTRVADLERQLADAKLKQQSLQRQETQYRALVQLANCIILRWDTQGRVKFLNAYGQRFFGFRAEEIIGNSVFGTIVPATESSGRDLEEMIVDLCKYPDRYAHNENENQCRDGRRVWISWSNKPILNEQGEIVEILSVGTDATERRQTEEVLRRSEAQLREQTIALQTTLSELKQAQAHLVQSEKMSSLGQLVAGVAHEINNPVNFIHGNIYPASQYVQELLDLLELYQTHFPEVPPEIEDKIEEMDLEFVAADLPKIISSMKVGADRIREIVHSLRTFSRLDEAEVKAVDIHEGIDSTLMILRSRLKTTYLRHEGHEYCRPDIQIEKHYGNLPPVQCHAGQLNQVFMNILSNAIDVLDEVAIAQGSEVSADRLLPEIAVPTIRIYTETVHYAAVVEDEAEPIPQQWIRIRIADNGWGMPEEVRQRIFDPFFTTKPVGKGTGLGMSISYQIVTERHGGRLECSSAPGVGTEFVIEIPAE
ncbi:MAG TPA: ATP-binding protein [Microcoleaceae cyanobacterium]|jgi:PAS domain S-box-containing protein